MIPVRMECVNAGHQGGDCSQIVFDFCNKDGNKINAQANAINNCKVIRMTMDNEARIDDETIAILQNHQLRKALLFSDIPCVNSNNWNFIKQLTEIERKGVHDQMKFMKQRWTTFNDICKIAKECNIVIVIDWPVACAYWKKTDVGNLMIELDLQPVDVHGCALGLVSVSDESRGKFIKKHWRFMTNCCEIINSLRDKTCIGNHDHVACKGSDVEHCDLYTDDLAKCLLRAFRRT